MRALVTGATGFLGAHLVRALAARGDRVRAVVRREPPAGTLPEGVEVRRADLARPATLDGSTEDIDVVFHLASAMRGSEDDFERVDIDGSRELLGRARETGAERFVYASTIAVYPFADLEDGSLVDDSTQVDEPRRLAPYARAKLAVEAMLRETGRPGDPSAVVVRPGLVYGPGSNPFLDHLPHLGNRRGNRYFVFGDGAVALPMVSVADTVDALVLCATVPRAAGETFLLVGERPPTQRQYVRLLAELSGRPLRVVALPRAAGTLLAASVERVARLRGREPATTRRLIAGKCRKLRYDCAKARRVLGWRPAAELRAEVARALAAWRENGAGAV